MSYSKTRNYLHYTKRHSLHDTHRIIKRYGDLLSIPRPDKNQKNYIKELNKYLEVVCKGIQSDWPSFMKFYLSTDYKKKKFVKKQSYSEWFDECNTDGTFAYNGVTDDF